MSDIVSKERVGNVIRAAVIAQGVLEASRVSSKLLLRMMIRRLRTELEEWADAVEKQEEE